MKTIKAIIGDQQTITVDPLSSVRDAARIMTEYRIGSVPVVDGERLVGIFTERDVMGRVVAAGLDPARTKERDVMSSDLVVADHSEGCDVCLERMQRARVRHIIVLNNGRLAGVVSLRDLLAVDGSEKAEEIALLNAYMHYIPADLTKVKS